MLNVQYWGPCAHTVFDTAQCVHCTVGYPCSIFTPVYDTGVYFAANYTPVADTAV